MLNTRNKNQQALRIEKVHARKAKDIFCGNYHSFYVNDQGQVFAWGMNNHGQLGIGTRENTCIPT
jgi:RCC1 and BTB domain-containing protein